MITIMEKNYPLDIVYVKVSVNWKLLDPIRKVSFKTGDHFPTITLQGNEVKKLDTVIGLSLLVTIS